MSVESVEQRQELIRHISEATNTLATLSRRLEGPIKKAAATWTLRRVAFTVMVGGVLLMAIALWFATDDRLTSGEYVTTLLVGFVTTGGGAFLAWFSTESGVRTALTELKSVREQVEQVESSMEKQWRRLNSQNSSEGPGPDAEGPQSML